MSDKQSVNQILTAPLTREHMPTTTNISLSSYLGRKAFGDGWLPEEKRIPESFGPRQAMAGFEEIYPNIIDYIVRITYKIWEDRDIEYIGDTYSNDSYVFDDFGLQRGNKKIIADTYATTGAFSDIQLITDDIVWAGNDELGYHTSHRVYMVGTNDGDSKFGSATGRRVKVPLIANCVAKDHKIYLEHVLYNTAALIQQLGLDLKQTARNMVADKSTPGWPRDKHTWQNLRQAGSPRQAISLAQPIVGFDPDAFCREAFSSTLGKQTGADLSLFYRADIEFIGSNNRQFTGLDSYLSLLKDLHIALTDCNAQVDEVYWTGNEVEGYLTSVRWSLDAVHSGAGVFGEASNKQIQFWGITQHFIVKGKIVKEWMMFNELDVLMQTMAD
jgi:predicted ester cyclase